MLLCFYTARRYTLWTEITKMATLRTHAERTAHAKIDAAQAAHLNVLTIIVNQKNDEDVEDVDINDDDDIVDRG